MVGGGWRSNDDSLDAYNGASLLEGARGGESCYSFKDIGIHGQGGFGGGGGGCRTGGIFLIMIMMTIYIEHTHTLAQLEIRRKQKIN